MCISLKLGLISPKLFVYICINSTQQAANISLCKVLKYLAFFNFILFFSLEFLYSKGCGLPELKQKYLNNIDKFMKVLSMSGSFHLSGHTVGYYLLTLKLEHLKCITQWNKHYHWKVALSHGGFQYFWPH